MQHVVNALQICSYFTTHTRPHTAKQTLQHTTKAMKSQYHYKHAILPIHIDDNALSAGKTGNR